MVRRVIVITSEDSRGTRGTLGFHRFGSATEDDDDDDNATRRRKVCVFAREKRVVGQGRWVFT